MHLAFVSRVLGLMLMVFSTSMLVPIIFATIYQEKPFQCSFSLYYHHDSRFLSWLPARNMKGEIRIRDGFIITVLFKLY